MNRVAQLSAALLLVVATTTGLAVPAHAQTSDYYKGKTLTVVVGLAAGGTADTFVRTFTPFLKKHMAGAPNIVVQNMTGAAGLIATNYLAEKAPQATARRSRSTTGIRWRRRSATRACASATTSSNISAASPTCASTTPAPIPCRAA